MTEAQTALAIELVAHPRWRWVYGMLPCGPQGQPWERLWYDDTPGFGDNPDTPEPVHAEAVDLSDYGTAAILLPMAMEAHREQRSDFWVNEILALGDLGTVAATALLAAWEPG